MSTFIHHSNKLILKIVYYGSGLCGKTTNLQYVYAKTTPGSKGQMISLATETERTLFFDFLRLCLGEIKGTQVDVHLYTGPGQVFYDASRKLILKGVDGIVFVADSQIERAEANIESLENLRVNLSEQGYDLDRMPCVVQYNKRDLPNLATIDEMRRLFNPRAWPEFEAVCPTGIGVFETLKGVVRAVLQEIGRAERGSANPEPLVQKSTSAPAPPLAPVAPDMDEWRARLEAYPDDPVQRLLLAERFREAGMRRESLEMLAEGVELLRQADRLEGEVARYQQYAERSAHEPAGWCRLADLHHVLGNASSEAAALKKACATLNRAGRIDEYLTQARRLLQISSDDHETARTLAGYLRERGELGEALIYLDGAHRALPDDPVVCQLLAETLRGLGRRKEAFEKLKYLARLLGKLGDLERSVLIWERVRRLAPADGEAELALLLAGSSSSKPALGFGEHEEGSVDLRSMPIDGTARGAPELRHPSRRRGVDVETEQLHPLAYAWRALRRCREEDRFEAILAAAEVAERLLLGLLLPDYLRGTPHSNVESRMRDLARPSEGQYVGLVRELADVLRQRDFPQSFFGENLGCLRDKGHGQMSVVDAFSELVEIRNSVAHRKKKGRAAASGPTASQGERAARTEKLLRAATASLDWLSDYSLIHVLDSRARPDSRQDVRLRNYKGFEDLPVVECWTTARPPPRGRVLLVGSDRKSALDVSMAFRVAVIPGLNVERLLVLKSVPKMGMVAYAHDESGAELEAGADPDAPDATFGEVLAGRANLDWVIHLE